MIYPGYEIIWAQSPLCEMVVVAYQSMMMYFDNQVAIYIVNNPMFHKRTKHNEVQMLFYIRHDQGPVNLHFLCFF